MGFKVGDRVVTKTKKYWNFKTGVVKSIVGDEHGDTYRVLLDEANIILAFKASELRRCSHVSRTRL